MSKLILYLSLLIFSGNICFAMEELKIDDISGNYYKLNNEQSAENGTCSQIWNCFKRPFIYVGDKYNHCDKYLKSTRGFKKIKKFIKSNFYGFDACFSVTGVIINHSLYSNEGPLDFALQMKSGEKIATYLIKKLGVAAAFVLITGGAYGLTYVDLEKIYLPNQLNAALLIGMLQAYMNIPKEIKND